MLHIKYRITSIPKSFFIVMVSQRYLCLKMMDDLQTTGRIQKCISTVIPKSRYISKNYDFSYKLTCGIRWSRFFKSVEKINPVHFDIIFVSEYVYTTNTVANLVEKYLIY